MKGVVIAGTHSGCGKTTITLGILAALTKKGYKVQPYKTGPDFIDTGLHKLVTGRTSRNLDLWMCGEDYVRECFASNRDDADIAVVEGVMGMYDGNISTADLAETIGLPVILVVDAYGMAESAGAVVRGFRVQGSGGRGNLAGVIFNRVASERHFKRLRDSVQDVAVLGYLPRNLEFRIPHRHLGLVVAEESPIDTSEIDKLADSILQYVYIDLILQITEPAYRTGRHRTQNTDKSKDKKNLGSGLCVPGSEIKIAVAYDRAFSFYYEDNLDLLREAGAKIIKFSPLSDSKLPEDANAVYIGGGYPELHAETLSANMSMLESVKKFADRGGPVYAECGGFMYLTEGIYDQENAFHSMAGVFPFKTGMTKSRAGLGYREAVLKQDSIFGPKGSTVRGHEFHYSNIITSNQQSAESGQRTDSIYSVKDGSDHYIYDEGYRINNALGSYIHIHFGNNQAIAGNFINFIKEHHGTDTVSRTR
jgi:cobyrinic acid a,c-diamide synthase